jgi:hypothetical protein
MPVTLSRECVEFVEQVGSGDFVRQSDNSSRVIDFVVTGAPRSGTGYVANVLQVLGVDCGHEQYFNPWKVTIAEARESFEVWGDASWMAAPFLMTLPKSVKVIHLVRNPVDCIRSILGTGQLETPNDYRSFAARHCWGNEDLWPTDARRVAAAMSFWARWNEIIEESGRAIYTVQVEQVPEQVPGILASINGGIPSTNASIAVARAVPKDVNTKKYTHADEVGGLSEECRNMGLRYGYLLER